MHEFMVIRDPGAAVQVRREMLRLGERMRYRSGDEASLIVQCQRAGAPGNPEASRDGVKGKL